VIKSELRETIESVLTEETNFEDDTIAYITDILVNRIESDCEVEVYDDEEALPSEAEEW